MTLERGDAVGLVRALVECDSRNPSLVPGAPGEAAVAQLLCDTLRSWGLDAELRDAAPGRPNVIARVRGSAGGSARTLLFNGHLDTVDIAGMVHAPFDTTIRQGRVYGRGASDMKGGVAAMCAAAARVAGSLRGDLIVAAVVDEEWESIGTRALIADGVRADAAIVTEPSQLRVMPAHKGFVWAEFEVHGRASHGSRWDIGIDAIRGAGHLLVELDRLDREVLSTRSHSLLGRPSLHASLIQGGVGLSTYPERCVLKVERRTLPGESGDGVMRELAEAATRIQSSRPEFTLTTRHLFTQPPADVPGDADVVTALQSACGQHGLDPALEGMSAWTDAALLNDAGIPAICFGPGDMGLAHAAEEYIAVDEVERATEVLATLARGWCA